LTVVLERGFQEYGVECEDTAPVIRYYRQRLKENDSGVRSFPDACDAVRELNARGFRQGVVTTKFEEACIRHLNTLALSGYFEVIVSGDHCTKHKPDPEPFCRALELLDLEPDECVMVGDSAVDILGARAAGIRSITGLWGTLDHEAVQAAKPDYFAEQPSDILALWS
jgi:pyrophosphatase PpaX